MDLLLVLYSYRRVFFFYLFHKEIISVKSRAFYRERRLSRILKCNLSQSKEKTLLVDEILAQMNPGEKGVGEGFVICFSKLRIYD